MDHHPNIVKILVAALVCSLTACATRTPAPAARVAPGSVAGVPRAECFPSHRLTADERAKSEAMLLKALDAEALYTLAGGLKPMSSVGEMLRVPADGADDGRIDERRRLLSVWRCGDGLYADARVFRAVDQGQRTVGGEVFYRPAVKATVERHAGFFAPLGLTADAHPMEILTVIEYSDQSPRWRGQGYLYGYPDYAVDFFAEAGESEARTGQFVARDFFRVPTAGAPLDRTQFVWAVPNGHEETADDRAIVSRAAAILESYRTRRAAYIGPGKAGAFALLRDWYCGDGGLCRVENAIADRIPNR